MINKKHLWGIVIFNIIYLLGFLFYYISIRNYEFIWYIVVLALVGVFALLTLKYTKLDGLALGGLSLWGLIHMIAGGFRINGNTIYAIRLIDIVNHGGDFYVLKMDQVIHFYGFAVAAIVVYQIIAPSLKNGITKRKAVFLAWIGSMGLGALNEIVEFTAFLSFPKTGVGDVYNTGFDLIFNMLGAIAGSLISASRHSKKDKHKS